MSLGAAKHGLPEKYARQALQQVAGWLPRGFIDQDAFAALWVPLVTTGGVVSGWRQRQVWAAVLPPPEDWPELEPRCSVLPDETPADVFVHTVTRRAFKIRLRERQREVLYYFPYLRIVGVGDSRTTQLHRRLHDVVVRFGDPNANEIFAGRHWGCRCTVFAMSPSRLKARGLQPPRR